MEKKRILCYGDSLTWGYIPGSGKRYSSEIRWTGVCRKLLGDICEIIEDGLSGRTTVYDTGRNPYQNGRDGLGFALLSQMPLDVIVLFLGTNDLEFVNPASIATGMDELVRMTLNANQVYRCSSPIFPNKPQILIVSPPLFHPQLEELMPDSTVAGKSSEMKKLAPMYKKIAENRGVEFLDAAMYAQASVEDCCHIDANSHERLGRAIAEKLSKMLEN